MFKLTYKELRDPQFRNAMLKLSNCSEYKDHKVAHNIMRMAKVLERELKRTQDDWIVLAEKYIQRTENGAFKMNETKTDFAWAEGVDKTTAEAAIEEFGKKEVVVERFKLKLDDIAPAKLSPADLAALEPLVTSPEIGAAP